MRKALFYQLLAITICICGLWFTPLWQTVWPQVEDHAGGGVRLAAPAFVKQAHAQEVTPAGIENILGEVGFSAYIRKDGGINLNDVKGLYNTIEDQTETYIIGTIGIRDYSEEEAPHVFISTDGWVMAYYPAFASDSTEIPVSRSIDIINYDGNIFTTKLALALNAVTPAIGVPASRVPTYYHFSYPDATHMTIIGETVDNATNTFSVTAPGSYTYARVDWTYLSTYSYALSSGKFYINDELIASGKHYTYGQLDTNRTILNGSVYYYTKIGIVFLYSKE